MPRETENDGPFTSKELADFADDLADYALLLKGVAAKMSDDGWPELQIEMRPSFETSVTAIGKFTINAKTSWREHHASVPVQIEPATDWLETDPGTPQTPDAQPEAESEYIPPGDPRRRGKKKK